MRAAGARANRRRSEIEAVIDGEQRILCLMLDALAELATAFSADNLVGLAERFSRGQLKAADMIVSSAPVFAAASESAAPYFSNGPHGRFLITRIEDGDARRVEAREFATSVDRSAGTVTGAKPSGEGGSNLFSPVVQLMDLPRFDASERVGVGRCMACYGRLPAPRMRCFPGQQSARPSCCSTKRSSRSASAATKWTCG